MHKIRLFTFGKGARYVTSFNMDGFEFDYDPDKALTFNNKARAEAVVAVLKKRWSLGERDTISIVTPPREAWEKAYIILLERFDDNRNQFANELYDLDDPRHFIQWVNDNHPRQAHRVVKWITRTT